MGDTMQEFVEHIADAAVQMGALAALAAERARQRGATVGAGAALPAFARRPIQRIGSQARRDQGACRFDLVRHQAPRCL